MVSLSLRDIFFGKRGAGSTLDTYKGKGDSQFASHKGVNTKRNLNLTSDFRKTLFIPTTKGEVWELNSN